VTVTFNTVTFYVHHVTYTTVVFLDINECMRWTFNCTDSSQICVNTDGSYKCECEEGLYWIDNKCKGIIHPFHRDLRKPSQIAVYFHKTKFLTDQF
jgi:hypothetical protein